MKKESEVVVIEVGETYQSFADVNHIVHSDILYRNIYENGYFER